MVVTLASTGSYDKKAKKVQNKQATTKTTETLTMQAIKERSAWGLK